MANNIMNYNNNNNEVNVVNENFDISALSQNELTYLQNRINERMIKEMQTKLNDVVEKQNKMAKKYDMLETSQNNIIKNVDKMENTISTLNILGHPIHDTQMSALKNNVGDKLKKMLGGHMSSAYILFRPYFYKWIYRDLAKSVGVSKIANVPMYDYGTETSAYNTIMRELKIWRPNTNEYERALEELIARSSKNELREDRANALKNFLNSDYSSVLRDFVYYFDVMKT